MLLLLCTCLAALPATAALTHMDARALGAAYRCLLTPILALVLYRMRVERGTIAVILGAAWLYVGYLGYTDPGERNYDGPAQLEYVEFIVQHRRLPPAAYCFICHHPPLYYSLCALVYTACLKTRIAAPVLGLQCLSLVLAIVQLVVTARLAGRFTADRKLVRLATALVAFWPYSVMSSVRVHNDVLASLLMVGAFYYAVVWYQEQRPRHLYLAAVTTALGVLTKTSATALVVLLLALLVVRFFRAPRRVSYLAHGAAATLILAASLGMNAAWKAKLTHGAEGPPGTVCVRVLGTACNIGKHQFVGNQPRNYVIFDAPSFVKEAYLIAEIPNKNREYFWNDLLKSSLFGTHNTVPDRETAYEMNRGVALVMNWLLLAMTLYLGVGILFLRRGERGRYGPFALNIGISIGLLMGFRALIPAPHHNDFRHVSSLVPVMAVLYTAARSALAARARNLGRVGTLLAVPFLGLSVFYFLPKQDWAARVTARVVPATLADHGAIVSAGSAWDKPGNLLFEANHTVELTVAGAPTVSAIDISLDNNDRYEVTLYGASGTKRLELGPSTTPPIGLARYEPTLEPPLRGVTKITLRALEGDSAYSMGHLVLR